MSDPATNVERTGSEIAIIGIAGRFPGASNIAEFWRNLRDGVESITFFSNEELEAMGISPAVLSRENYIKAKGVLDRIDMFDAAFFGFNPREAEITDPQHRIFLECAWESLENAGYDSKTYQGLIGVYAGVSPNSYVFNLYMNPDLMKSVGGFETIIGNDKDFLTTRVSYKLGLRGPSFTVQTACSTSLVAVHVACQGLLSGECDMALAGGVSVTVPQKSGYFYQEEGIASSDGHCRAFDSLADGTVPGNGVGIVVLKRLEDALADRDHIYAVIKSSVINNDGSLKVGYTAPSVEGQSQVIKTAQVLAEVEPETIGYVETHGTGTPLGDPIEIAALTEAFTAGTTRKGFCALGSVKTNVGHLDAAAGVAGLIKTVLALNNKLLPPSLHFERPNPNINFEDSPFYVNTTLKPWKNGNGPRRAGVSSFGIGGTNAHVVLEEAPTEAASGASRPSQLVLISARNVSSLESASRSLVDYFEQNPNVDLADAAYTLKVGRRPFNYRRMVVCGDRDEAIEALKTLDPKKVQTGLQGQKNRPVFFMFPGGGTQYPNMGIELYKTESVFRQHVDECLRVLDSRLDFDLRRYLYPGVQGLDEAARALRQTAVALPALFVTEYALAKLWMSWGVEPAGMIGHSLGEYVAACLAGVFSLEEALALVAERGRLMQKLPSGAMLSVPLSEQELLPILENDLSIAAINGPSLCAISGPIEAIDAMEKRLNEDGVEAKRIQIDVASHSSVVNPILAEFTSFVEKLDLRNPSARFISNVTGTWITGRDATDPKYWARHLAQTVRFADGIRQLLEEPSAVLLEAGPGKALTTLSRQHTAKAAGHIILNSMRPAYESESDVTALLSAAGRLWVAGLELNWKSFYKDETRRRIPLPTYSFDWQRYWIDRQSNQKANANKQASSNKRADVAEWFYVPSWKRVLSPDLLDQEEALENSATWLVFADECHLADRIGGHLRHLNQEVFTVKPGEQFERTGEQAFTIAPESRDDYAALIKELVALGKTPANVLHLWNVTREEESAVETEYCERIVATGFESLVSLAQAIGDNEINSAIRLSVVTSGQQAVTCAESLCPEKALALGPAKVISHEYPNISCKSVDIDFLQRETIASRIIAEAFESSPDQVIAYRNGLRWVQSFEPVKLNESNPKKSLLKPEGTYLITGGLSGVGYVIAEYLARVAKAKLVLIGRSQLTDESEKIRRARELEEYGAEVLILSADVTSLEQMREARAKALDRFAVINGIIHAAGLPGGGMIQLKTAEAAASVLAPKVLGTRVIDYVFREDALDFLMLCSSLNSVLGSFGHVDYCAANAFLDAFACYNAARRAHPTISVDWDRWQNTGMAVAVEQMHKALAGDELSGGMSQKEATDAFGRILSANTFPHVIVSVKDFQALVERNNAPKIEAAGKQEDESRPPESAHARPMLGNPYVAPRNDVENRVAEIWRELLGLDEVGIHDDFGELGGHSLLATRVIARVRAIFEVEISLRRLFETPTVAGLAEHIQEATGGQILPPIVPVSRDRQLPLSFAQQRLWFIDQLEPGNPAYNIPSSVRVKGELDLAALNQTLSEIIRRHESLRTCFKSVDGLPIQIINPPEKLTLPLIDLSELEKPQGESEARRLVRRETLTPFDLTKGPMLRATLLRLGEADHVVVFTMHHIASDGWSMGVLIKEVAILYEAFSHGQPSPLADLPIQYADFAHWQRDWLRGEVLEEQLSFWKEQLDGAPRVLELPTDRPRPRVQTYRGAMQPLFVPKDVSDGLKDLSKGEGATLFMTLLAAFMNLLYRYTGQTDIVVSTGIANRTQVEMEELIGFFVNTLVLRTKFSGDAPFREMIKRVREVTLGAYAHQDVAFETLMEALKIERNPGYSPFVQIMFVLQNTPQEPLQIPGLALSSFGGDSGTARIDLFLSLTEGPEGLSGSLQYNTDLFDASTISGITSSFLALLNGIVEDPDRDVDSIPMISEEESRLLIGAFND